MMGNIRVRLASLFGLLLCIFFLFAAAVAIGTSPSIAGAGGFSTLRGGEEKIPDAGKYLLTTEEIKVRIH